MELAPIDHTSTEPPFEQVRRQIAAAVAAGDLPTGAKLPTVRGLAGELGLAVNTVARVYRELEADGVVVTEGRRGTFVAASAGASDTAVRAGAAAYADLARRHGLSRADAGRLLDDAWTR